MATFPSDIEFSQVKLTSVYSTDVDYSRNGRRNARKRNSHLWRVDLKTGQLNHTDAAKLEAFFSAREGQFDPFDFNIHNARKDLPLGAGGGTPLVNAAHAAGVSSIVTDGWPASTTVLKAGDLVQFASHQKTYHITADVTSDGSGNATLSIKPGLMEAIADNSAVTYNDVPMRLAFASDEFGIGRVPGPFHQHSFELIEAWNT